MSEEPTNADLLAAIERLGASAGSRFSSLETRFSGFETHFSNFETRFSSFETRLSSFETRLSSVEKTGKDTNAIINRIDIRLRSVEATVDEISVTTGVSSKAIGVIRAELEALEKRVKKLESA